MCGQRRVELVHRRDLGLDEVVAEATQRLKISGRAINDAEACQTMTVRANVVGELPRITRIRCRTTRSPSRTGSVRMDRDDTEPGCQQPINDQTLASFDRDQHQARLPSRSEATQRGINPHRIMDDRPSIHNGTVSVRRCQQRDQIRAGSPVVDPLRGTALAL